ncbi:MAG: 1,2-phenylacetyl-CoA epoxidase subunit PaaD [Bacteroidota bacterium]
MEVVAKEKIWKVLSTVTDPEVPVLTILDLGIVRAVNCERNVPEIVITPTYTGCPAMNTIEVNIKAAMQEAGYQLVDVKTILSPAWTTDWLSEEGKRKLREYGIAPPVGRVDKNALLLEETVVPCPLCHSTDTEMLSQFGSTACKSLYRCKTCLEPFDYFKCH